MRPRPRATRSAGSSRDPGWLVRQVLSHRPGELFAALAGGRLYEDEIAELKLVGERARSPVRESPCGDGRERLTRRRGQRVPCPGATAERGLLDSLGYFGSEYFDEEDTASMQPTVWTFFYGSFINLDVLAHVDLRPDRVETARVHGFDITIRPLANLVRSERDIAYGILATATHDELERLYAHAEHDLGGRYLPEAIVAETREGTWRPALCYIAPELADAPASDDYVDRISVPARLHGFPDWYVQRIESFRSGTASTGA